MGVDRTSYLLYGFKVKSQKKIDVFDDHYEELMEEEPYSKMFNNSKSPQAIIQDCMCGEYVYIGIKLAEVDEYDDDACVEINKDKLAKVDAQLKELMQSWPPYLISLFSNAEPKLYFFIHAY